MLGYRYTQNPMMLALIVFEPQFLAMVVRNGELGNLWPCACGCSPSLRCQPFSWPGLLSTVALVTMGLLAGPTSRSSGCPAVAVA